MLFMYSEGRLFYIKIADFVTKIISCWSEMIDMPRFIYTIIGEIHGHCKRLSCFIIKYFGSEKLTAWQNDFGKVKPRLL